MKTSNYPELKPSTWGELNAEVFSARMKFPENSFLLTALMEEVGELARAYLQGQGENRVRAEALQVACVALRIYEESDPVYAAMTKEQQKA